VPPPGWWATKLRRTRSYLRARVSEAEREAFAGRLAPAQLALFDRMHLADRRHGLDVMTDLERRGAVDQDLLVAGLLHDCGKGPRIRFVHRVAWSLGQHYGAWIWRAAARVPTFRAGLAAMRDHAERSARLAAEAGCSARTIALIRNQEKPTDEEGRLLLEADESN
jgi:hypothetical protein